MSEPGIRRLRVLVALTGACPDRLPLDVCRYLLGDTPPDLIGLFVEERELLEHAGSRLAREIMLSGSERRLEQAGLERQLRARSAALRRLFEADAARLGADFAFEVVRGELRGELRRAAERADALVVDAAAAREALEVWSGERDTGPPLRTLLLTRGAAPAGSVTFAATRNADLAAAPGSGLGAALRLARRTRSPLTVLLGGEAAERGRRAFEALRRTAAEHGVEIGDIVVLEAAGAEALGAHARDARVLVLTPPESLDPALAGAIAARLRGALMLLRGD